MAKESAALLSASSAHLGGLLAELYAAMPSLSACGFAGALAAANKNNSMLAARHVSSYHAKATADTHSVSAAVSCVTEGLGVDMGSLEALLSKTKKIVGEVAR